MKLLTSLFAAATLFALCAIPARAGTLTINSNQPSFSPTNAFSNNTITAQIVGGNLLQIFGSTNIAITPGGSATISVSGTFSADQGYMVSFFYNFGINLTSSLPVSFTLQATANTQVGPVTVSDSGTVMPGNHQYSDMGQSAPAPIPLSGSYTASLTFNFGNATIPSKKGTTPNGADFLSLTIPTNGLEFQLAPTAVPEPSTYALLVLGLGAALFAIRRYRLA